MSKRNGKLSVQSGVATIEFERRLPFSIQKVWEAITDPKHRAFWLGETKPFSGKTGELLDTTVNGPPAPAEMRRAHGKILKWEPPRLLEHEWNQQVTGHTVVRYELREDGDGTILRYVHSGLSEQHAKGYIPGEHAFQDRLEAYLLQKPLPEWLAVYGQVQASYGMTASWSR